MTQQEHIPVFYEGQDDLIDVLATSMASVCYNTSSFIDFYILDCGICKFNKKLLETMKEKFNNFSIEFIPVDLKQFKGLKGWGPQNKYVDCYARLLISGLKPNLDKCIYLDSDTMALDDITKLWKIDLQNYYYAAAIELGCTSNMQNNFVKNLGLSKEHRFPNAGVFILNLKKWREDNIEEKIINLAKKYNKHLLTIHEDLFSLTFGSNNYKKLDLRFNLADRINRVKDVNAPEITDDYVENEWKNAVIQHLTPTKPWQYMYSEENKITKNFSIFWFYAKMTPFYAGMMARYNWVSIENIVFNQLNSINFGERFVNKRYIKLFGIIPIVTIKRNNNKIKYKLFGFLPILTEKRK